MYVFIKCIMFFHHNLSSFAFVKQILVVKSDNVTNGLFFSFSVTSPSLVKSGKVNSTESLQELLTSDSEGSCMGVGSPRDMQSPVFHDKNEVNL